MPKTAEKKVKDAVVAILKEYGAYYFFPIGTGYSSSGVPDIIVCYDGRFIAIECKAGSNTLTPLQERNINQIHKNGGVAVVINEENVNWVEEILRRAT
jgi:Holliday junction resolvase